MPALVAATDPAFTLIAIAVVAALASRMIYKTTWLWSLAIGVSGILAGVALHALATTLRRLLVG